MMSSKDGEGGRGIGAGQVRESAHGGDLASSWKCRCVQKIMGVHVMWAAEGRSLTPPSVSR